MKKLLWTVTALFTGIYIFIPEFTDVVPIIGWLDEATAFTILLYALNQLGIDLGRFFGKKKKTIEVEKN
ncbi:MAG: hypothetical protein ACPG4Z_00320 [Chitinophagales bacterium]